MAAGRSGQMWVWWALLGVAVLAGCTGKTSAVTEVPFAREAWSWRQQRGTKLATAHYDIYTTIRDDYLVDSLPGLVEAAFKHYQELVPPARESNERMKIYLFASRGQWAMFTKEFAGARAPVFLRVRNGGYSERGISVIQYVSHQTTFPLLAHEGFHQYLYHYVNPSVPAWLNEGLATMCEGQRWGSAGLKAFDPWYNPARRNELAQAVLTNKLFSLRELLDTHAGKVVEGTTQEVATYYAQLWALMLFLRDGEGGKYGASLDRMLLALGSPELDRYMQASRIWAEDGDISRGEALFCAFIADDLSPFEAEYREFLRTRMLGGR